MARRNDPAVACEMRLRLTHYRLAEVQENRHGIPCHNYECVSAYHAKIMTQRNSLVDMANLVVEKGNLQLVLRWSSARKLRANDYLVDKDGNHYGVQTQAINFEGMSRWGVVSVVRIAACQNSQCRCKIQRLPGGSTNYSFGCGTG